MNRSNQLNITLSTSKATPRHNDGVSISTRKQQKGGAFSRYRMSKDFEDIEKWLDSKEMQQQESKNEQVGCSD